MEDIDLPVENIAMALIQFALKKGVPAMVCSYILQLLTEMFLKLFLNDDIFMQLSLQHLSFLYTMVGFKFFFSILSNLEIII